MLEPIPVRVTRYRCPHCHRSHASKARCVAHIGRCWDNPEARGCKTCEHFQPYERGGYDSPDMPEACALGIRLSTGGEASNLLVHCTKWEKVDNA